MGPTCRSTPSPTWSTARSSRCRPSPTRCSCTTARTCSTSTGVPEPKTWDELIAAAKKIQDGEKNPNLQGLSTRARRSRARSAPSCCRYWGQGKDLNDAAGKLTLDKPTARQGLIQLCGRWSCRRDQEEHRRGQDARHRQRVQGRPGGLRDELGLRLGPLRERHGLARCKGKVGVMPLPAMAGGKSATCIGGWQWAVSAFSKNKAEAAKLVQLPVDAPRCRSCWRSTARCCRSSRASTPIADVLKANPWFKDAAAGRRERARAARSRKYYAGQRRDPHAT